MNSLFNILQLNEATDDDIQSIHHSSYYDLDNFKLLAERNNERFSILRSTIESINATLRENEAFLEEHNQIKFKFSLICLQESWLPDNDDLSHIQIEGYRCITQCKTCINKGGLVIYLNNKCNFKVMLSLNQLQQWEGQFIKITDGGLKIL